MQPMSIMGIKSANTKKIIDILRFSDGLTKKEIAAQTDLSFATVSNLCNVLREKHVLCDEKQETVSVGRTPNVLYFQYDRFCCVSLDLQLKDLMVFSLLNFRNEIIYQKSYDISSLRDPQDILEYAKATLDALKGSVLSPDKVVAGVGIAVSATHDLSTGKLVLCAIPAFEGVELKRMAEEVFHLPCYVDKESNLCAISVNSQNLNCNNIIYLHCSEGVGAGVICEGRLVRGKNGCATEVAHLPLGSQHKKCPSCGSVTGNCIENELSLAGLLDGFMADQAETPLLKRWEIMAEQIRAENPRFAAFAAQKGHFLGRIAAVLISIFDPAIVYIGGNISLVFHELLPYLDKELQHSCLFNYSKGLQVVCDDRSEKTISTGISEAIYQKWIPA